MPRLTGLHSIADLRRAAQRRLPRGVFEFVDRGAEDDLLVAENRAALDRIRVVPRFLRDISARSTATTLFGKPMAMPLAIAPTGAAGLIWHEGELALARAAAAAGVPFTNSTNSMSSIARVGQEVARIGGRLWLQLYVWRDQSLTEAFVRQADQAGAEVLMLTVDTPIAPHRDYNIRNGWGVPVTFNRRLACDVALHPRWLLGTIARTWRATGIPSFENHPEPHRVRITGAPTADAVKLNEAVTWETVARLREIWPRVLLLKGILHPEDARRAVQLGADGVIVSNHGGRNLDIAIPAIDALPAVVAEIGGRATVLMDSGIRRGADILRALALGAQGVLTGRATLFGTAVAGEAGAARALEILRHELDVAMAMTGCATIADIGPGLIAGPKGEIAR